MPSTDANTGFKLLAISLMACLISACQGNAALSALNAITPNSGYTLTSNVPFGSAPRQRMDIYERDESTEKSRVVEFVHGGVWRQGIKDDYAFIAHALASQGHWVVVPDYRLYPQVTFPAFAGAVGSDAAFTPSARELRTSANATDTRLER